MSRTGVGSFFAYAGIGLALLGAAVLVGGVVLGWGEASVIAGTTPFFIGVIWTLVGFGLRGYYARVTREVREEARLFESGERASAVVENVEVTATRINDNPVIDLALRVSPRAGAEFVHERRLCVPPNAVPLPGHLTDVAFDPRDRSKVALDVDERLAAPPARYVRTRPPEDRPAPPADEGLSVVEQLERLQKLRERGALTEAEFAAQKARILLEG